MLTTQSEIIRPRRWWWQHLAVRLMRSGLHTRLRRLHIILLIDTDEAIFSV